MRKKNRKEKENEYSGLTWQQAYEKACDEVERGETFRCDLRSHDLYVGEARVVDGGRFSGDADSPPMSDSPLQEVERLYESYRKSIPSERSERKRYRGTQFRADDLEELTDDDMVYGERRDTAQARLEMFVLFSILSGALKWYDSWGTWFWRSDKDRDLVLLKDWFNKQKENDT